MEIYASGEVVLADSSAIIFYLYRSKLFVTKHAEDGVAVY